MSRFVAGLGVCAAVLAAAGWIDAGAQDLPLTQTLTMSQVSPLDPSRDVMAPMMESKIHTPLPEQYVWTATEKQAGKVVYRFPAITAQTEPHYFRAHFRVDSVPREATLYIAGPRSASVWVNGELVEKVAARAPGFDLGFVIEQRGMFSYSGLSKEQVHRLRGEFSVYAIDSGRICVAALNTGNVDYVADAIAAVVK